MVASKKGTGYAIELENLPATYESALSADLRGLKAAISGASEASIIGVGSGGSYTVASLLCSFHEKYTGRVSRASTPLEIICNPTLAASSPVFLISAEGKNPDARTALVRAREHSARTMHILTNRGLSPLIESANKLSDISTHVFDIQQKDGYLATNSLLFDAIVVARAYGELDDSGNSFPKDMSAVSLADQTATEWALDAEGFLKEVAARGAITIIYSPLLYPIAADIESKFSESALVHCQVVDLRSYAHGRHLWLSERANDCALLVLTEPTVVPLWESMHTHIPEEIPTLAMNLAASGPVDITAGLIAGMHLVSALANHLEKDPGKPHVPTFGRALYYLDLSETIPPFSDKNERGERSKYEVLGAGWPSRRNQGRVTRARQAFQREFKKRQFQAIVFDYDGTLCSSNRKEYPPSPSVVEKLRSLIDKGITIGIASGRGGSVQECLQEVLTDSELQSVELGLYNGGWVGAATGVIEKDHQTSEFLSHITRLVVDLKAHGVPIQSYRPTHPYQVSIRFHEGISTEKMWFVIADSLRQAGLGSSSIVRSKHSIDILAPNVNKSRLVAHIIEKYQIVPYKILTMGDQGAWPGNDSSLLEHRFSLSVDQPCRRIDRGWKMAPPHKRDVDATLWYLERIKFGTQGEFTLELSSDEMMAEGI